MPVEERKLIAKSVNGINKKFSDQVIIARSLKIELRLVNNCLQEVKAFENNK